MLARPNPSKKLINQIINKLNYNHAVIPIIKKQMMQQNVMKKI